MIENYINEVKECCRKSGMDPAVIPTFTRVSQEKLLNVQKKYEDMLVIIRYFMEKLLSKIKGIPLFVSITDDTGLIIEFMGDKSLQETVVEQLGLEKGVLFIEKEAGVNSASTALHLGVPVELKGQDHYHHFLFSSACYSVPLFLSNNRLVGTISIMTFLPHASPLLLASLETVADNIQREIDLLERNKYLDTMNKTILEQTNTGYLIVDGNGRINNMNPSAETILAPLKVNDFLAEPFLDRLAQALNEDTSVRDVELLVKQSNALLICLVDFFPFLEGVMVQIRDITEYKKTEIYMQNTEKLTVVGQLAAGVAHEIKNPLTTLKGFLKLIQEDKANDLHFSIMNDEIERINQVTSELLVLSKPMVISKNSYDIRTLLQEIGMLLTSYALQKNIEITQHFEAVSTIICDANQLKQVFINIVKNSVEALHYNGKVDITVKPYSLDKILIRIEDNGTGFPDSILHQLGEPFLTTKKEGNGLGLMICKRIVESIHEGELKFYNNQNKGAIVEIILPKRMANSR